MMILGMFVMGTSCVKVSKKCRQNKKSVQKMRKSGQLKM